VRSLHNVPWVFAHRFASAIAPVRESRRRARQDGRSGRAPHCVAQSPGLWPGELPSHSVANFPRIRVNFLVNRPEMWTFISPYFSRQAVKIAA
jgi:hypothetical protein